MKLPLFAAVALASTAMAAPAAAAPVIGTTLTCASTAMTCSSASAVQGSGVEFTGRFSGMSLFGFDFSDGLLTVTNPLGDYAFAGKASFRFGSTAGGFGSATVLSNTGFAGLSQASFSLADGVLTFAPTVFSASRDARLTLSLGPVAGAVPEPASWAMMMLGFGMMGYALRRRGPARVGVTA